MRRRAFPCYLCVETCNWQSTYGIANPKTFCFPQESRWREWRVWLTQSCSGQAVQRWRRREEGKWLWDTSVKRDVRTFQKTWICSEHLSKTCWQRCSNIHCSWWRYESVCVRQLSGVTQIKLLMWAMKRVWWSVHRSDGEPNTTLLIGMQSFRAHRQTLVSQALCFCEAVSFCRQLNKASRSFRIRISCGTEDLVPGFVRLLSEK